MISRVGPRRPHMHGDFTQWQAARRWAGPSTGLRIANVVFVSSHIAHHIAHRSSTAIPMPGRADWRLPLPEPPP